MTTAKPAPAPDRGWSYALTARNHATLSDNKIHADDVAAAYGFRGGLVPGADVYAYLAHPPSQEWGVDWLSEGGLSARFASPVYDGDRVTVEAGSVSGGVVDLAVRNARGDVCATGTATRYRSASGVPDPSDWPRGDPSTRGLAASPESLAPGTALVPLELGFHADGAAAYLDEIGEDLPLYRDGSVAHPGWLLRLANFVLAVHVRLGPWIHVGSDARFFGVVGDGARVEVLGVVADEYERRGHRFVELDVLMTADGRPAQHVTHTAIHTPRAPQTATEAGD